MGNRVLLVGSAILVICASGVPAHSAPSDGVCRKTIMPDNSQLLMCKDSGGRWHEVDDPNDPTSDGQVEPDGLPPHATVIFRGTWSASMSVASKLNFSNLNVMSVLNQLSNARTKTMGGDFVIVATISGSSLTGYSYGAGFPRKVFTGTIRNGSCQMADSAPSGVDRFEGQCGPNGFSGTINGQMRDGNSYSGSFQTSATQVVDLDQQQRERVAAAQAQQALAAAAEAKLRNAPAAGPALTRKLEGFVQADSRGWAWNHFDAGTITNVKVVDGTVASGSYVLRGEYKYNGGQSGWVLAKMAGPKLQCILFWDAMIGCRNLRTPEQGQKMRDLMVKAVTGASSGRNISADNGDQARRENYADQRRQENENEEQQRRNTEINIPEPARVEPIGGDSGLFGDDHSVGHP